LRKYRWRYFYKNSFWGSAAGGISLKMKIGEKAGAGFV